MSSKDAKSHNLLPICLLGLLLCLLAAPAFGQTEHVHEMYYNNFQWVDTDLTTASGGALADAFSAITAFYTTPNQQLHVYFVDHTLNHVQQLYYNGSSWSNQDLTSFTGGPAAYVEGISGFAIGNLQYIFYVGLSDGHVHEINYNNLDWTDQDVTAAAGGTTASPLITAFLTKPNNQFHVYYQDANSNDEKQLYFNGTSWSDSDLTSYTGASCFASWIAGVGTGNLQHLFCAGGYGSQFNLDMIHIEYNNFTWVSEDITAKVGGLNLNLGSGVAGFRVPGAAQGEIYGVTDDTHIHQYEFRKKTWSDTDLSGVYGAPLDGYFGAIVAFPTTPNNQFHIYYQPNNELYQLYYNGSSWNVSDLTGGGGQADYFGGGMAGFAIGNLQHVYYLAAGN